jgi:hypothetical protein
MWCMDKAQGEEQNIDKIALRILLINFGAIHTTSMVTQSAYSHRQFLLNSSLVGFRVSPLPCII